MISQDDLKNSYQSIRLNDSDNPIDVKNDVIPIYREKKQQKPPSKIKLGYDLIMLVAILVDLGFIFFDQIMMSTFFAKVSGYLGAELWLVHYKSETHGLLSAIGGFFTIFLMIELIVRWLIAIRKKTYYRWFFFPFVHWYEVLGCFPLLRPLRLLRAIVLIRRLHELGVNIIPKRLLKSAQFYGHVLMEELSDRVILTAIGNFKTQLKYRKANQVLLSSAQKNRQALEKVALIIIKQELIPKLKQDFFDKHQQQLSKDIGRQVEHTLMNIPELRKYLKLIPIAGGMIEAQMADIGKHMGENIATAVGQHLVSEPLLDELATQIAHRLANIDTTNPILQEAMADIIDDVIAAFEAQVRIQQWKHGQHLPL